MRKYLSIIFALFIIAFCSIFFLNDSFKRHTEGGHASIESFHTKKISKNGISLTFISKNAFYKKNNSFFVSFIIENTQKTPIHTELKCGEFISPFLSFDKQLKEDYRIEIVNSKNHSISEQTVCKSESISYSLSPGKSIELLVKFTPKFSFFHSSESNKLHLTGHFNNVSLPYYITLTK